MRKVAMLLLIVTLTVGCSFLNNHDYYRLRGKSALASSGFRDTISFKYDYRLIVVPVTIRGKEYPFIFDTGASNTIISRQLFNDMNLKTMGDVNAGDSQGNRKDMDLTMLDSVLFGDILFTNISANIVDWPENSAVECISEYGIIGNNLIRHAQWHIDYQEGKLVLSDHDLARPDMEFIKMHYPNGRPYIDLRIGDSYNRKVLFDSGSAGSVDISQSAVKANEISGKKEVKVIDGSSQGLHGSKTDTLSKVSVDSLFIGSIPATNVLVNLEKSNKTEKIGNDFLSQWQIYLDYSGERVGFSRIADDEPVDSKSFGVIPIWHQDSLYIASVYLESAAWKSGLRYGDVIVDIQGRTVNDFQNFCDYFDFIRDTFNNSDTLIITRPEPDGTLILPKTTIW